jgi:hypothetical protein
MARGDVKFCAAGPWFAKPIGFEPRLIGCLDYTISIKRAVLMLRSKPFAVLVLAVLAGVAAADMADSSEPAAASQPERPGLEHASLAAYPQSVISLKDPDSGQLYYVESGGRRLVAFDNDGKIRWSKDVFEAGNFKPARGAAVIRELKLKDDMLHIACGRHAWAKAELKTGKIEFMGED